MNQLSQDKFANAVLYVLSNCPERPGLMALLKLLFRADFEHYRQYLKPITGASYIALKKGPVPENYTSHLQQMIISGHLTAEGYKPLHRPELAAFDQTELAVLKAVVEAEGHKSGTRLSAEVHEEPPWRCVWRDGEGDGLPIPYVLARWEDNRANDEDVSNAAEMLKPASAQLA